jgi:hypothetical protein
VLVKAQQANTLSTEKTIKPIQVETPSNPVIEKDLWRYIANRYTLSAPDQKNYFGTLTGLRKTLII